MAELPYPTQDPSELRARSVARMFDDLRRAIRAADVAATMYRKALHSGIASEIRETSVLAAQRQERRNTLVVRLQAFVTDLADYADVKAVHDTMAPRP